MPRSRPSPAEAQDSKPSNASMALHASYLLVIPHKEMHIGAKHRALAEPDECAREIIVVFHGG